MPVQVEKLRNQSANPTVSPLASSAMCANTAGSAPNSASRSCSSVAFASGSAFS